MRGERERNSSNTGTGTAQRRIGYINAQTTSLQQIRPSLITWFLQRPHSIPFVLALFLFLAWISLRVQRAAHTLPRSSASDRRDAAASLVRFLPSRAAKDNRGWLFDPVALALASGLKGTIKRPHTLSFGFRMELLCVVLVLLQVELSRAPRFTSEKFDLANSEGITDTTIPTRLSSFGALPPGLG